MQLDVKALGGMIAELISEALEPLEKQAVALRERVAELENRQPIKGEPGPRGDRGLDAPPVSDDQVDRAVVRYLRDHPPAKGDVGEKGLPGDKGDPGKDAPPVTDDQIASAVERYIKANPIKGEKGDKGDPGADGPAGQDAEPISLSEVIRELLECDEMQSLVELRAKEAVAAIPTPKDGAPGKDGLPGPRGEKGEKGERGEIGATGESGIGLAGAMIDRDGTLIITTTKGEAVRLGNVVGKDGSDGLGFDDMSAKYDGERGVVLRFARGDKTKEFSLHLPVVIDRGYWHEGFSAKQGDAVTHDGTLWIALKDTGAKPSLTNKDDWRIAARKGRDGRDGRNGRDAPGAVKLESPGVP